MAFKYRFYFSERNHFNDDWSSPWYHCEHVGGRSVSKYSLYLSLAFSRPVLQSMMPLIYEKFSQHPRKNEKLKDPVIY